MLPRGPVSRRTPAGRLASRRTRTGPRPVKRRPRVAQRARLGRLPALPPHHQGAGARHRHRRPAPVGVGASASRQTRCDTAAAPRGGGDPRRRRDDHPSQSGADARPVRHRRGHHPAARGRTWLRPVPGHRGPRVVVADGRTGGGLQCAGRPPRGVSDRRDRHLGRHRAADRHPHGCRQSGRPGRSTNRRSGMGCCPAPTTPAAPAHRRVQPDLARSVPGRRLGRSAPASGRRRRRRRAGAGVVLGFCCDPGGGLALCALRAVRPGPDARIDRARRQRRFPADRRVRGPASVGRARPRIMVAVVLESCS